MHFKCSKSANTYTTKCVSLSGNKYNELFSNKVLVTEFLVFAAVLSVKTVCWPKGGNNSTSVDVTDDTLSQSEYSIVVCLSISRLPQVFLDVQWFRHSDNCPPIGWFLSRLKFSNELRHRGTLLWIPVAAGPDDGVSTDQGKTLYNLHPAKNMCVLINVRLVQHFTNELSFMSNMLLLAVRAS